MKTIVNLTITLLLASGMGIQAQTFVNFTSGNGLPSDNVNGIAIDGYNNKWFGTQAGVARYNDTTWTTYTTANGLIDNYINCIAVDIINHIWVGTDVGISKFDGTLWTSYTSSNGLIDNMVSCITGDPDGSVWIGTNIGVSNFNGTTWKNYTTADGLPSNTISYIAVDLKANKWFGTWTGGLAKFNGTSFTNLTITDSLLSNNISAITIDHHNKKWIGTYQGISLFDSLDHWVANYRSMDGVLPPFVQDLAVNSKNILWIGVYDVYTQDGGIAWHLNTSWKSYTVANGLVNKQVKRLAVDNNDNVWIATGLGVSKLTDQHAAINDLKKNICTVYPNPASKKLFIDHLSLTPVSLTIIDVTGNIRLTRVLPEISNVLDISSLNPGVYFLQITDGETSLIKKLIVL